MVVVRKNNQKSKNAFKSRGSWPPHSSDRRLLQPPSKRNLCLQWMRVSHVFSNIIALQPPPPSIPFQPLVDLQNFRNSLHPTPSHPLTPSQVERELSSPELTKPGGQTTSIPEFSKRVQGSLQASGDASAPRHCILDHGLPHWLATVCQRGWLCLWGCD